MLLFSSGAATIVYILITKKIPLFVASTWSFVPLVLLMQSNGYAMVNAYLCTIIVGLTLVVISFVLKKFEPEIIDKIFPPVVIGPVVLGIGAKLLASVTWQQLDGELPSFFIAVIFILAICLIARTKYRSCSLVMSVCITMIAGVILSKFFSIQQQDISVPLVNTYHVPFLNWTIGSFNLNIPIVLSFVVYTIDILCEHVSDVYCTSTITGKPFYKDPGIHKAIFGLGMANIASGLLCGFPVTSYGESIGAQIVTKKTKPIEMIGAGIIFMLIGFFPITIKQLQYFPLAMTNAMSLVMFSMIGLTGIRLMVRNDVNLGDIKSLMIAAVIVGISLTNANLTLYSSQNFSIELHSITLAIIAGILIYRFMPDDES
jgi:uracil permease